MCVCVCSLTLWFGSMLSACQPFTDGLSLPQAAKRIVTSNTIRSRQNVTHRKGTMQGCREKKPNKPELWAWISLIHFYQTVPNDFLKQQHGNGKHPFIFRINYIQTRTSSLKRSVSEYLLHIRFLNNDVEVAPWCLSFVSYRNEK